MNRRSILRLCGSAAMGFIASSARVLAQGEKTSGKDSIVGKWTLMIADDVGKEGSKVPGFGPLPNGTATFGSDGHYSLQLMSSSGKEPPLTCSGTYTLDDAVKTLTLRVDQSSAASWRGTTQTGKLKFLTNDYLGWTQSTPLAASSDFTGAELIWRRAT
jgi:Lipocalin-like domain